MTQMKPSHVRNSTNWTENFGLQDESSMSEMFHLEMVTEQSDYVEVSQRQVYLVIGKNFYGIMSSNSKSSKSGSIGVPCALKVS
jgi:hypothetical protein